VSISEARWMIRNGVCVGADEYRNGYEPMLGTSRFEPRQAHVRLALSVKP